VIEGMSRVADRVETALQQHRPIPDRHHERDPRHFAPDATLRRLW
jgi:hypothetical protein